MLLPQIVAVLRDETSGQSLRPLRAATRAGDGVGIQRVGYSLEAQQQRIAGAGDGTLQALQRRGEAIGELRVQDDQTRGLGLGVESEAVFAVIDKTVGLLDGAVEFEPCTLIQRAP